MNKSLYFSHDYTASDDVKILFLRQSLGMEGVGIFWYIIERMAQAGGRLPLKIIPVLSMQMQVTEIKVQGVVNNFDLFIIEDADFYSNRLNETINLRKTLQDAGQRGAVFVTSGRGNFGNCLKNINIRFNNEKVLYICSAGS